MKPRFLFAVKNYRPALIAAVFFGCVAPGAKLILKDLPAQSTAGILYFFAGLGLFSILLAKRELFTSYKQLQKKDYKWLIAAIVFLPG